MSVLSLSQATIPTLTCGNSSRKEYCDANMPGLLLEVRPSGFSTFWYRYKKDGRSKYSKLGTSDILSLAEARKMARLLKAKVALGADPSAAAKAQKEQLTFDQFYEQHLKPYCSVRKKSWKRDEQLYRIRIKGVFGNMCLNQITRHQLQKFHTELYEEGLSYSSADLHMRFLKHAFYLAIDWGLLAGKNECSRIPLFNVENYVNNIPNDEEFARLIQVLQTDPNRPICQLAIFLMATSMRLGEALSSCWSEVDLPNRVMHIKGINSKNGRQRSVNLSDTAVAVLEQLDSKNKYEHDHIFVNKLTGLRYRSVGKTWIRIRNKAGLPKLRWHDLRHLGATLMINSGVSLHIVMKALGHSNPAITERRYAHVNSKTMQHAVGCASTIIENAMKQSQQRVQAVAVEALPALPPPELLEAKAA